MTNTFSTISDEGMALAIKDTRRALKNLTNEMRRRGYSFETKGYSKVAFDTPVSMVKSNPTEYETL